MELTWINKLRIAAVAGLGIVVMGILAWPLAAPADPLMPVRASNVSASGTLLLIVLAFAIGLAGYFIAWPHGREIGILGVPFGLVIWAGRSGPMRALTQAYQETAERAALVHSLRLEPAYWLLLVAAGFAGVLLAQYLRRPGASETSHSGPQSSPTAPAKTRPNTALYVNCAIAVVVAVVISQFFVGVFVQNLAMSHGAAAQPAIGQIIFGVAAAFAVAAFVVKRFLDLSYLWPAVASLFIVAVAETLHYNAEMIRQFAETNPAPLFPHSVFAILPVQLVTLGTLGSVLGYWMAVRYDYWRKHETG
jgi:hypothetical protein